MIWEVSIKLNAKLESVRFCFYPKNNFYVSLMLTWGAKLDEIFIKIYYKNIIKKYLT